MYIRVAISAREGRLNLTSAWQQMDLTARVV